MADGRFSLLFQEQIKGPKNASIARFDGLCCYQIKSETGDAFCQGAGRAEAAAKSRARAD